MYDYVVWCAAFVCTLSCLNLYWTRDNKLSYLILSYLIKIDLTVLRLILCIGEDRITSHHMCKVGGRF